MSHSPPAAGGPTAPRLLAISDRRRLQGGDLAAWALAVAAVGVDAIMLREKDLSDRCLYRRARALRDELPRGCRLLVNGRADIAVAAGADGVHLPSDGLPTQAIRRRFPRLLVGRSTHSGEEIAAAAAGGAHYVVFGPVFPTPGKGGGGPLPGLAGLARAAAAAAVPVLALGGISEAGLAPAAAAGAAGVAAIRLFLDPAALGGLAAEASRLFGGRP